ncbi:MAG: alkane 1-monooxygenase [Ramlibacter sp.]|nr:alkane 1-monooxygenase [Ramlibacter sp.]
MRMSDARFLLIWLLPTMALLNVGQGAARAGLWTLMSWALIAGIDAFWPGAQKSPPPAAPTDGKPPLAWLLRLYVPLQLGLMGVGLFAAAQGTVWEVACLALAVGFVTGGQGITYAHELGHSRHRGDRLLAWVLMTSVGYPQFMVEHYRGHHVRAATRDDPASARRGESLWRFLPRTVGGSFMGAWRLEAARLRQLKQGWLHSPLAWATAVNAALVLALAAWGQYAMLGFWLGQSAFAIWLLETVNYIEHYGLERQVSASGQREPFGLMHAWNADHMATNSVLANLQRHSDHHMHAWKPFPTLQALPGPQLPTGYAGCLMLAALPPLWFGLMHPRLDALRAQGLG